MTVDLFSMYSCFSNITFDPLIVVFWGIFVGIITGLLGAGGGTLVVPFLLYYLGLDIKMAEGTSLFQIVGIAFSGASQHYRIGTADLKLATSVLAGSSVAVIVGAKIGSLLPSELLKGIFGIFVIFVSYKFFKSKGGSHGAGQTESNKPADAKPRVTTIINILGFLHHFGAVTSYPVNIPPMVIHRHNHKANLDYDFQIPKVLGLGAAVGFLSGIMGVGGGFLLVPGLVFLGIPIKVAVGTDLSQMTATAAIGAMSWYSLGYVDPILGGLLMAGGIAGTFVGTRLNKVLPTRVIKKVFSVMMFIIGVKMVSGVV